MKRALLLATILLWFYPSQEARTQAADLVIRDVTVVSPERQSLLEHAYIRIDKGRITEVSRRPLKGSREIDGAGRFLIPGLIDSHVHLVVQVPGMTFGQATTFPDLADAARKQEPRSYLFFGFTTVIDLFGTAEKIGAWNRVAVRPDAFFCGAVPVANGFPMNVIPEAVRFASANYFLYDARQADRIPTSVNPAEHTPAAVVNRMASDGAACIKAHYEPGNAASAPLPTPTPEMFKGLARASRAKGIPLVVHANVKVGQRIAVDAGADIVTHTIADGVGPDGRLARDVESLLAEIARRRIGYQPTLRALHGWFDLLNPDYLRDPRVADAVPPALLEWFRTPDGGRFREGVLSGARGEAAFRANMTARQEAYALVLGKLITSNARLLFGSDSPATASYGNLPGLNGRLEMDHWVASGVSLRQLLRALTIENARAFGLDKDLGTVETGKRAHLLLLRRNPLASVEAYDTIETVIVNGEPTERTRLSARNRP